MSSASEAESIGEMRDAVILPEPPFDPAAPGCGADR